MPEQSALEKLAKSLSDVFTPPEPRPLHELTPGQRSFQAAVTTVFNAHVEGLDVETRDAVFDALLGTRAISPGRKGKKAIIKMTLAAALSHDTSPETLAAAQKVANFWKRGVARQLRDFPPKQQKKILYSLSTGQQPDLSLPLTEEPSEAPKAAYKVQLPPRQTKDQGKYQGPEH